MSDLPKPRRDWALFLDIDGTLIDIAPRPDAVVVPEGLPQLLCIIRDLLGGALALVSGRRLDDIDRMMSPYRFPCAAEHGGLLRFGDETACAQSDGHVVPESLREKLRAATVRWPGAAIEEKTFNIVVHYRQAPSYRDDIHAFVRALVDGTSDGFEILPARMAFEIRHRALNKGTAVNAFMERPLFAGRTPVFVGDDTTDEDGFRAAEARAGIRLDVRTAFAGEPAHVRAWLATFALQLRA
jgi:trehalose 6-phosphate phosphatase